MTANITLEEIPFGNLNEAELNETKLEDHFIEVWDIWDVCEEFLELFVLLASLLSGVFIIYTILKFKTLGIRTNYYLLHYIIANIIFIMLNPLYQLLITLYVYYDLSFSSICFFYLIDEVLINIVQTFGFLLGLDYFIICCFNQCRQLYERTQKYLILSVYIFYLLEYIVLILGCLNDEFGVYTSETEAVTYVIIVLLMTLLHIIKFCKKLHCADLAYAWKISNYAVYSWIPLLINYLLLRFVLNVHDVISNVFMSFIQLFFKILIYSPPIVIAFWLPRLENSFSKSYRIIFGKIGRKYNQEDLDDNSEENAVDNSSILI